MTFRSGRWILALGFTAVLAACGGSDDGDGGGGVVPPPGSSLAATIRAAAADPANDTSINSSASFTVLQNAGVPAVTVNSPPVVKFTVFSDGGVVRNLAAGNARFAIAKLVPASGGNPDKWLSYVYRTETATAGVGPGGNPVLASAKQATTDSGGKLEWNDDGYYTYTFGTDITDPSKTNGVVFEPGLTHRVAIQLSYKNAAGATVLVNPYFDFTVDSGGKSVTVTDPSKTRKMADVSSCNSCHEKLALHGGGRVDVQYCVMCHNPGTTDANSGNVLTMATMTHKIHAGRLLKQKLDAGLGGEEYVIWGYQDSKHDYSEVGFPQDLRNCAKCHTGANPNTPQGDNWKNHTSKEACLTCHANKEGSTWWASHEPIANVLVGAGAKPTDIANADCQGCHKPGSNVAPDRVHWNQNEENAAKYKMNIESAVFNDTPDRKGRSVTVKYYLSDPTNGNATYNLVTSDCTGAAPDVTCSSDTKFGNLRLYVVWPGLVGQSLTATEYSSYNIGGSGANGYAYKGVNDGNNHYTLDIPVPDDTATMVVQGTGRVVSIGQIKEPLLEVKSATDPRPEVVPTQLINTLAQNTFKEFPISGSFNPRRQIVSNDKCNACHGALGATSGSNTLANAFHRGARNTVEACVVCHDANRMSSTVMASGLQMSESYHMKRMIHGIHGNSKRVYPFTHGNKVVAAFGKDGISLTAGFASAVSSSSVSAPVGTAFEPWLTGPVIPAGTPFASGTENYAAEVAWPGVGLNCNACHVDDSYKADHGSVASVVRKPISSSTSKANTDPGTWLVISPKAASCTACHDSAYAIGHVTSYGGSSFGDMSQSQYFAGPRETCDDCHAPGFFKGVDVVHGLN